MFRPLLGRGHLDFCPFRHEVCKDLRFDSLSRTKLDFKVSKLDRSLDDAAVGVAVAGDFSHGERRRDLSNTLHPIVGVDCLRVGRDDDLTRGSPRPHYIVQRMRSVPGLLVSYDHET
jgi:hypothetical protein